MHHESQANETTLTSLVVDSIGHSNRGDKSKVTVETGALHPAIGRYLEVILYA